MSSTNRSNARDEHIADYYVTPISDIELFLKSFQKVIPLDWNNSIIVDPTSGGNPKTDKDAYHPMSYPTAIKNIYGIVKYIHMIYEKIVLLKISVII